MKFKSICQILLEEVQGPFGVHVLLPHLIKMELQMIISRQESVGGVFVFTIYDIYVCPRPAASIHTRVGQL